MRLSRKSVIICLISLSMLLATLAPLIITPASEKESPVFAQQSDELIVSVNDPMNKLTWNHALGIFEATWRNETWYKYNVSIANSNYSDDIANVSVSWRIEREVEAGTYWIYEGPSLNHSYTIPGEYWINVSVEDPDEKTGNVSIFIIVNEDLEGDGIPDWWELHYFGTIAIAFETSNFDGDSWTDLEEYERGTDPTIADVPEPGPSFTEKYWWVIAAILILVALILLYLFLLGPYLKKKRQEKDQKRIAAALEIEKALASELEEKKK